MRWWNVLNRGEELIDLPGLNGLNMRSSVESTNGMMGGRVAGKIRESC